MGLSFRLLTDLQYIVTCAGGYSPLFGIHEGCLLECLRFHSELQACPEPAKHQTL